MPIIIAETTESQFINAANPMEIVTKKTIETAPRSIPLSKLAKKTGVPQWNYDSIKAVRQKRDAFLKIRRTSSLG